MIGLRYSKRSWRVDMFIFIFLGAVILLSIVVVAVVSAVSVVSAVAGEVPKEDEA